MSKLTSFKLSFLLFQSAKSLMCSVEKLYNSLDPAVNARLEELRRKIVKLEKEAGELKRLKSDCDDAGKFRKMLVKERAARVFATSGLPQLYRLGRGRIENISLRICCERTLVFLFCSSRAG